MRRRFLDWAFSIADYRLISFCQRARRRQRQECNNKSRSAAPLSDVQSRLAYFETLYWLMSTFTLFCLQPLKACLQFDNEIQIKAKNILALSLLH
jgi:hypothetical protein